jgi:hypothetical protein
MAVAIAGLIAGWMQSAALLRFGNAKRASFMGLRPNIRCQQRTGDDGPVCPQICHDFPQAAKAYTTSREPVMRRDRQEPS